MSTALERQRRRRQRLQQDGRVETTLALRAERVPRLRALAAALDRGEPVSLRLLPALAVLRGLQGDLHARGVARAGVFGSTARGADGPDSDVDVVLALAPDAEPDPLDVIRIEQRVQAAFAAAMPGVPVDVSILQDMRPQVRARAEAEAVYAD